MANKIYMLAVDIGSTNIKARIYDGMFKVQASNSKQVPYVYPEDDSVEIDPLELWNVFVNIIKKTLKDCNIQASDLKGFGFCCQRSTGMIWYRYSGEPFCNLISWQDKRCGDVVQEVNDSWLLKGANVLGYILFTLLRHKRFLALKAYKGHQSQCAMKVAWLFKQHPELHDLSKEGEILFGTIDTWIIWKLSKGNLHVTDYSNASATGMYDPFILGWSSFCGLVIGVKAVSIFPTVVDTSGAICEIDEDIFGSKTTLTAVVADAQAATFGMQCFKAGQVGVTTGTGCFLSFNTGSYIHASVSGIYPLIGWKNQEDLTYLCETHFSGMGASIESAKSLGLFDDVSEIPSIVDTVEDSDGVFFTPGFYGLCAPYNDPAACAGFIGVKTSTSKAHMLRAVIEGCAFMFYDVYEAIIDETTMPIQDTIRLCGGVGQNNLLLELICALTNCKIERMRESEMSLVGTMYLAGLGAGIWKDKEDIPSYSSDEIELFQPDAHLRDKYIPLFTQWQNAVKRCLKWY